ncbi:MAG TPA: hypothetical protein VKA54_12110 [Gemmatimonadaceae bacterium]|nr:hypothetical protein [Gemmatimonadaceae bacterium]
MRRSVRWSSRALDARVQASIDLRGTRRNAGVTKPHRGVMGRRVEERGAGVLEC